MKYLLDQREYDDLVAATSDDSRLPISKKKLQALCTKISDTMPVKFWGKKEAEPWGCIYSRAQRGYCDECPVQEICPSEDMRHSK